MTKTDPSPGDFEVLGLNYLDLAHSTKFTLMQRLIDTGQGNELLTEEADQQATIEDYDIGKETAAQANELEFTRLFLGANDPINRKQIIRMFDPQKGDMNDMAQVFEDYYVPEMLDSLPQGWIDKNGLPTPAVFTVRYID